MSEKRAFYVLSVCSVCGKPIQAGPPCEHVRAGAPREAVVTEPMSRRGRELALTWIRTVNDRIDEIEQLEADS